MTFKQAIKEIIKGKDYTQQDFIDTLNEKSQSNPPRNRAAIAMALKRGNPKLETLIEYADALGYELRLVPVGTKVTEGTKVLDDKDEEV